MVTAERLGGGGNETGWYGSQVLYGCNSLTRNLVSSEPNSFNVHFALHILLMLRAPVLDAGLQMGLYKGRVEEDIKCSQTYFSLTLGGILFPQLLLRCSGT